MVVFPNAKINLGLHIFSRYPSGYHQIDSILYPIGLTDVLEVVESNETSLEIAGFEVPGNLADNLCLQAYNLLSQDFDLPPVAIYLFKKIPMGAGLGGGSSDASHLLLALNQLFELDLTFEQLENYAGELGSDCPFFIRSVPTRATGTGLTLQPVALDLPAKYLVLVHPGIHVSTPEAYSWIKPRNEREDLLVALQKPVDTWQNTVVNDFEAPVTSRFKEIATIKDQLLESGAAYTAMTGSGSCVFGLFDREIEFPEGWNEKYHCFQLPVSQ